MKNEHPTRVMSAEELGRLLALISPAPPTLRDPGTSEVMSAIMMALKQEEEAA